MRSFRLYWPALVVAMIASFVFEAAWFSFFMKRWLAGIGRTMEWMETPGAYHPVMQYGTAMLCSLIAATVLSIAIQVSGEQTVKRGVVCAAVLWLGFVATSWAKEYVFEVRTLEIYGINVGYALLDMMLMGAIVGGWSGKARSV